jgi:hypothetical protein
MKRRRFTTILALGVLLCAVVWADPPPKRGKRRWLVSIVALVAAGAADVHSSYGGYEANPLLRSANGRLEVRGVAIKFGLLGAVAGVEHLIIRKRPEAANTACVSNLAATAALTAVAVRNDRVRAAEELRLRLNGGAP